jgi:hypothetical protein
VHGKSSIVNDYINIELCGWLVNEIGYVTDYIGGLIQLAL